MDNRGLAGYPLPVLVPAEVRGDPDEENPHELVLDGSEVNAGLPPLDLLLRSQRGGDDEPEA